MACTASTGVTVSSSGTMRSLPCSLQIGRLGDLDREDRIGCRFTAGKRHVIGHLEQVDLPTDPGGERRRRGAGVPLQRGHRGSRLDHQGEIPGRARRDGHVVTPGRQRPRPRHRRHPARGRHFVFRPRAGLANDGHQGLRQAVRGVDERFHGSLRST